MSLTSDAIHTEPRYIAQPYYSLGYTLVYYPPIGLYYLSEEEKFDDSHTKNEDKVFQNYF